MGTKIKGIFFNQDLLLPNVGVYYIVLYYNILLIWIVFISHPNPCKFRFTKTILQFLSQGYSNIFLYFISQNITPNNCDFLEKRIRFAPLLDLYNYMAFPLGVFYILAASSKRIPLTASIAFN